jgi:dUTP pyrophosphatase
MNVKIKKLHENAVVPFKTYDSDFCYDVVAVSEQEVAPNVWKYGLGIALQIERDKEICDVCIGGTDGYGGDRVYLDNKTCFSIDLRSRSSIWKTGMTMANSQATIDEDYTGEIFLVFYHVMPNMPRYKVGDKIAQMKIGVTFPIYFEEVSELSETERGEGGFGSSGK